jgi:hypothetical protein
MLHIVKELTEYQLLSKFWFAIAARMGRLSNAMAQFSAATRRSQLSVNFPSKLEAIFSGDGAGEGIRTLNPNLGKVTKDLFNTPPHYAIIRYNIL